MMTRPMCLIILIIIKRLPLSALEVFLNDIYYINSRFTYLFTYLLRTSFNIVQTPFEHGLRRLSRWREIKVGPNP